MKFNNLCAGGSHTSVWRLCPENLVLPSAWFPPNTMEPPSGRKLPNQFLVDLRTHDPIGDSAVENTRRNGADGASRDTATAHQPHESLPGLPGLLSQLQGGS
jgi:hypothetical protein